MSKLRLMTSMYSLIDPLTRWAPGKQLCAFVLMAKAPRVGGVKTRLTPPLTPEEAAELSRCFIRDMAADITSIANSHGGIGVVAFTPPDDVAAFDGLLPLGFHLLPQRGSDLGERLLHATEDLLVAGFAAVCLINADSPNLPRVRLAEAAELLRQPGDRVVLGEADDGGYYLIGLKRAHVHLFHRIDWSTSRVFRQSIERAAEVSLEVARLASWYDVDDAATLRRLYDETVTSPRSAKQPRSSDCSETATSRFLRELAARNPAVRTLIAESPEKALHH